MHQDTLVVAAAAAFATAVAYCLLLPPAGCGSANLDVSSAAAGACVTLKYCPACTKFALTAACCKFFCNCSKLGLVLLLILSVVFAAAATALSFESPPTQGGQTFFYEQQ